MKKIIFMCVTFALMACASEDNRTNCFVRKNFDESFSAFVEKQKAFLKYGVNKTRSNVTSESVENLLEQGERIDKEMDSFIMSNESIIRESAPNVLLTEMEWDMLTLNDKKMLDYINTNVSRNIGYAVDGFLNNNLSLTMDEISNNQNLTPYEKTLMLTIIMHSDFRKELGAVIEEQEKDDEHIDETYLLADARRDLALCEDDYMMEFRDCGLVAIGTMLGGFLTGGSIWLPTLGAYGYCQYSARKAFNRCKRDVRLRYGL